MNDNDSQRSAYIAGLRSLANILEAHPEFPLPYTGSDVFGRMHWIPSYGSDQKHAGAMFARLIPGKITKDVRGNSLDLNGQIEGLHVDMLLDRDDVCERVVVETREITEEVPDPDLLAELPTVTRTRTEEVVEWRCGSILAGTEVKA